LKMCGVDRWSISLKQVESACVFREEEKKHQSLIPANPLAS
jgi:hypothetical protein